MPIHEDILAYNAAQSPSDRKICDALSGAIARHLPKAECKIWHRHPVWFLDGNPIVGYSKLKDCIRLLFWSGQSFTEPGLTPEGSFKAAEARYTSDDQITLYGPCLRGGEGHPVQVSETGVKLAQLKPERGRCFPGLDPEREPSDGILIGAHGCPKISPFRITVNERITV